MGSLIITACRSCGAMPLVPVLSLGATPLANALLTAEDLAVPEERYPLDLLLCEKCSLVQLSVTVPPAQMFREYPYFSSVSDEMQEHARDLAGRLVAGRRLDERSLVVEIGSNDGYLLRHLAAAGVPVLGVEPARNVAAAAEARGVRTCAAFFDYALARELARERRADVVVACNVMAHVPDVNDVVAGVAELLAPGGVFVVETPYVRDLVDHLEYDTIYHEHVFYYSLASLAALLRRHGLTVVDVERLAIHGGSLRVTAARAAAGSRVVAFLEEEARWGATGRAVYEAFARRVADLREELRAALAEFKGQGLRVAAYGAAAKGATLLHSVGDAAAAVEYVVDRSPHKQGRHMPGSHQPIFPPGRLLDDMPDRVLLLTWNFEREVVAQQAEYLRRGGKFVVPVPRPRVVGAAEAGL